MTLQHKIEQFSKELTTKDRNGENITIFADNASEELRSAVYEAHGDRLPSDWIFSKFSDILSTLNEYTIESIDDVEENRPEIVDGLVDVYTSDLTSWLHESNYNVYYMTEAQEEYGAETDGFKILQMAQYKAIDEIYGAVVSLLDQEEEEEEEEA